MLLDLCPFRSTPDLRPRKVKTAKEKHYFAAFLHTDGLPDFRVKLLSQRVFQRVRLKLSTVSFALFAALRLPCVIGTWLSSCCAVTK